MSGLGLIGLSDPGLDIRYDRVNRYRTGLDKIGLTDPGLDWIR